MKKKHQPTRTCLACRRIKPKSDLIRIVRRPDRVVEIDESGKANGRGAYLCQYYLCWQRALKRRAYLLKRTLKVDLDRETYQVLKTFAKQYQPPEEEQEEQAEEATSAENQSEADGTPKAENQSEADGTAPAAETPTDSASDEQAQKEKPAEEKSAG